MNPSEIEPGQFEDAIENLSASNEAKSRPIQAPARAIVIDGRGDAAYIDDVAALDLSDSYNDEDGDELLWDDEEDEIREEDLEDNRVDDEDWDVTERGAFALFTILNAGCH